MALVVLVVISAVVTLVLTSGILLTPFDIPDLVDRLVAIRVDDERLFPLVIIGSLAALGVYFLTAMLGLLLRAWAAPTATRDAMSLLLVFGGLIGITSQVLNIGVGDAARPFLCDCGYRAEEMVGLERALHVGWSMVNWTAMGALTMVGLGVAVAARVVEVSSTWRLLSYVIAVGVLIAVALRFVGALVFIEPFDPYQVSDIVIAITSGLLVPFWAVMLARGVGDPEMRPVPAPA